jgi:hypothetical protein
MVAEIIFGTVCVGVLIIVGIFIHRERRNL